MVDAVDVVFGKIGMQAVVQMLGSLEVLAERLFNHQALPVGAGFIRDVMTGCLATLAKSVDDGLEILRRDCQIENPVAQGLVLFIEPFEKGRQGIVAFSGGKIELIIIDDIPQALPLALGNFIA